MRTYLSRLAGVALLIAGVAVPVVGPMTPAWSAPPGCTAATPAALADFFDGAVPPGLTKDHVPGTVVSVVTGGHTVFAKGYGLADAEHGVAFDPDRSLVRIASITKLFTWTAVMQQVQAGRLDLNADVNRYLRGFQIPATYPQPITLLDLMDHTAGFEYSVIGTGAQSAADVPPLAQYLAAHMPARIRPPGVILAYSNYGAALAGYIVSVVSGEPYDEYVLRHILEPLGMTHTTATEPIPAALAGDLARSYDSDTTPPQRIPFTFDIMAPDGSISTTANDMAKFAAAQLDTEHSALLDPATLSQLDGRSFAADPRLGGFAHGFMERIINGHHVLMHDGSWEGFESVFILVPGCDLGMFLSTNATGGIDSASAVLAAFFDRFIPPPAVPDTFPPAPANQLKLAAPLAGFYESTRHNESTVEKLTTLVGSFRLSLTSTGGVHFFGADWTPQGNGLYQRADGGDHLVFLVGPDGQHYVATDGPSFQLLPAGQTPTVNLVVLLGFAVIALSTLVVALAALVRRLRHRPSTTTTRWRVARWLAVGASVLGLVFLVGLAAVLLGDTSAFIYAVPVSFRLLLVLPILVGGLAGASLGCTVAGWRGSGAGLLARVHQVVVFAGLATLGWFTWEWNLIGWQF